MKMVFARRAMNRTDLEKFVSLAGSLSRVRCSLYVEEAVFKGSLYRRSFYEAALSFFFCWGQYKLRKHVPPHSSIHRRLTPNPQLRVAAKNGLETLL